MLPSITSATKHNPVILLYITDGRGTDNRLYCIPHIEQLHTGGQGEELFPINVVEGATVEVVPTDDLSLPALQYCPDCPQSPDMVRTTGRSAYLPALETPRHEYFSS